MEGRGKTWAWGFDLLFFGLLVAVSVSNLLDLDSVVWDLLAGLLLIATVPWLWMMVRRRRSSTE
jgi:hypothetical protein